MAYNILVADRIRIYLSEIPQVKVEEKKMFSGLAFLVNGKMCINVSGENLMCRFDPNLQEAVADKNGFEPMLMKGKKLTGYCYVLPTGFNAEADFQYWMNLCLDFNKKAKPSKKK
ncbi:MAG: TfoX/Sxy family protein [Rufibacter sp.]